MRVIFMGTPDFSVPTMEALIDAGHEMVLAVTQPDRPKGRGKGLQRSPVGEAAFAHGIALYQPERIRKPECVDRLRRLDADVIVVVAYGQILPREILEMTPYGCVNVHASLLPKYRGAAPIQWAVINGDSVTGVTTMLMDEGIDTGDILLTEEVALADDETGGSLFERLSDVGAHLCVRTLEAMEDGTVSPTPQDPEQATKVGLIRKEFGCLDWSRSAAELERLIRGLDPWPSAWTEWNGKTLKIWKADVSEEPVCTENEGGPYDHGAAPGTIVEVMRDTVAVQTGEGILLLREVQPEGRKRMPCDAFLRGYPVTAGSRFGSRQ